MTSVARRAAFSVLTDVYRHQAYPNLALQRALARERMHSDDRALCTNIVYGTLQRQLTLDALIFPLLRRGVDGLDPQVLTILRMTVYQLCFLSKIPEYAALNEAVELAKIAVPRAKGFVNGVLRTFVREGDCQSRIAERLEKESSWDERMSVLYSMPAWIVSMWQNEFGEDGTTRILESLNQPGFLSLRVNEMKVNRDVVLTEIHREFGSEAAVPSPVHPSGIRLTLGFDIERWAPYREGTVSVQDEAAMLVAPLLQPRLHRRVLDMCAAPGSKTAHIAELQGDDGSIDAVDVHPHKGKLMEKGFSRLHLKSIRTHIEDARRWADSQERREAYDAVLLDAPCSGFGVMRHRPDIRYKRTRKDVLNLVSVQRELLSEAMRLVRKGGLLVYSTCTLNPAENEDAIRYALAGNDDFEIDDIRLDMPQEVYARAFGVGSNIGLTVTPDLFGTDGFYLARLRRKG